MKKLLLSLLMAPMFAMAHGSSHPPVTHEQTRSTIVDMSYAQRVLVFQSEANAVSNDGIMLVCRFPSITSYRDGTCLNNNQNAWQDATKVVIPGFELIGFEYRWVGSGYRNLILYYSVKK
jgi:hypothetical protein